MKLSVKLIMASIAIASVTSCSKDPYVQEQSTNPVSEEQSNKAIVIRASGDITEALNEFRELLGTLNTPSDLCPAKNSREVEAALFTSLNTTPKP